MSKLKVVILLASVCCLVKCDVFDMESIHAVFVECSRQANVAKADIETILAYEPAKTMDAKCLRACAMKNLGILNTNNRIDKEATKNFLLIKFGRIEGNHKLDIEACANVKLPSDECEAAEAYFLCILKFVNLDELKEPIFKA